MKPGSTAGAELDEESHPCLLLYNFMGHGSQLVCSSINEAAIAVFSNMCHTPWYTAWVKRHKSALRLE